MTSVKLNGAQVMYITSLEDDFNFNEEEEELAERWKLITDSIEEVDLDGGYQKEQFVVINTKDYPDKFFAFDLYYDNYNGWAVDNNSPILPEDIVELYEVEPVPSVTYKRKYAKEFLIPIASDEVQPAN